MGQRACQIGGISFNFALCKEPLDGGSGESI